MQKLLITILVLLTVLSTWSFDHQEFTDTLGWETKWDKIIDKSVSGYINNLKKNSEFFSDPQFKQDPKLKADLLQFIRNNLEERLSWETMGQQFSLTMLDACSFKTLNTLVRIKKDLNVTTAERQAAIENYQVCAPKGFTKAMDMMYATMMEAKEEITEQTVLDFLNAR